MQWLESRRYIEQSGGTWKAWRDFDRELVPDRLEAIVEKRVDMLPDGLALTVRHASIQGEQFRSEVLTKLRQVPHIEILKQLRTLAQVYRMVGELTSEKLPEYQANWQFSHSLVHRTIYEDLGQAEQAILHGEIVDICERLYADQLEDMAGELAFHCESAGQHANASEYRLTAAHKAAVARAFRECLYHTNSGLENLQNLADDLRDPKTEIDLLYLDSRARFETAENLEIVKRSFERGGALAVSINDIRRLVNYFADAYHFRRMYALDEMPSFPITYDRLWQAAKDSGDALSMARCCGIGIIDARIVGYSQVIMNLDVTLQRAEAQNDIVAKAIATRALAYISEKLDSNQKAMNLYKEALELERQADHETWRQLRELSPWFPMPHHFQGFCLEHLGNLHRRRGGIRRGPRLLSSSGGVGTRQRQSVARGWFTQCNCNNVDGLGTPRKGSGSHSTRCFDCKKDGCHLLIQ